MASNIAFGLLISFIYYLILLQNSSASVSSQNQSPSLGNRLKAPSKYNRLRPWTKLDLNDLYDMADDFDVPSKRQFDDYGHMRFGKRGDVDDKFDDYGHMRFGRSH